MSYIGLDRQPTLEEINRHHSALDEVRRRELSALEERVRIAVSGAFAAAQTSDITAPPVEVAPPDEGVVAPVGEAVTKKKGK